MHLPLASCGQSLGPQLALDTQLAPPIQTKPKGENTQNCRLGGWGKERERGEWGEWGGDVLWCGVCMCLLLCAVL